MTPRCQSSVLGTLNAPFHNRYATRRTLPWTRRHVESSMVMKTAKPLMSKTRWRRRSKIYTFIAKPSIMWGWVEVNRQDRNHYPWQWRLQVALLFSSCYVLPSMTTVVVIAWWASWQCRSPKPFKIEEEVQKKTREEEASVYLGLGFLNQFELDLASLKPNQTG